MRLVLLLTLPLLLLAQTVEGPTFEAASIKPVAGNQAVAALYGGPGTNSPTRARSSLSVHALLYAAFDLPENFFVNTAKLPSARFEFEAVIGAGASKAEYLTMLRNFLIERFHFRYHRETRDVTVYELRVAPGGHKLKPTANDPPESKTLSFTRTPEGYLTFPKGMNSPFFGNGPKFSLQRIHTTMDEFAAALDKEWLHSPVVNLTGLDGQYDFYLTFDARRESPNNTEVLDPPLEPSMQSQLGLLLKQGKQPREVVVIDTFDKEPTPN